MKGMNKRGMIRCRMRSLMLIKASVEGRKPYSIRDIASATGLTTGVVHGLLRDSFARVNKDTIVKVCEWGGWTISDVLEYIPGGDTQAIEELEATDGG